MDEYRTCSRCGQLKHLSEWAIRNRATGQLGDYCRLCRNAINRESYYRNRKQISERRKLRPKESLVKTRESTANWIKENPERARQLWSDWAKNNPQKIKDKNSKRRARKRNSGVFLITDKELDKLAKGACFYCGREGGEIDHVVPLARGGRHSIGNLVSCCKRCNRSKGAKLITEWKNVGQSS